MIGSSYLPWGSSDSNKNPTSHNGPKKLLGLLLFKVDESTQKVNKIGEAFELRDFSIFYRSKLRSAIQAISEILANQTIPGGVPKIINDDDLPDHSCLINFSNKSICCILVMKKGFPINPAVFYTNLISNEVLSSASQQNIEIFLKDCLAKYENYDDNQDLLGLSVCLDELKVIMSDSIQQAMEKGGKLDELVNECQQLDDLTRQYVLKTKKLNSCCNWW